VSPHIEGQGFLVRGQGGLSVLEEGSRFQGKLEDFHCKREAHSLEEGIGSEEGTDSEEGTGYLLGRGWPEGSREEGSSLEGKTEEAGHYFLLKVVGRCLTFILEFLRSFRYLF
jgi:hypothetical protein